MEIVVDVAMKMPEFDVFLGFLAIEGEANKWHKIIVKKNVHLQIIVRIRYAKVVEKIVADGKDVFIL